MFKIWRILAVVILVLTVSLFNAVPVGATPELFEYWNTGGDADSADIYGANYVAQQFTSDATTHSVTSILVELKKTGTPLYVKVSLRNAVAGLPDGADLVSATLLGTYISTGYAFYEFDISDYSLLPSTQYAIVVSCPSGDNANYIEWHQDSGGGLANGEGSSSTDSGVTWASDAPADYVFEVWGETILQIKSANVFTDYLASGDWLIAVECLNEYTGYADTTDVTRYFNVQLLDPTGTDVISATTLKSWGDSPVGIYLSPTSVIPLTYGDAYIVRMIGTFTGTPSVTYTLDTADWRGSNLANLDKWAIQTAKNMNTYYENVTTNPYTVRVTGGGEILTAEGGSFFTDGIYGLQYIRPTLFQTVTSSPEITIDTPSNVYDEATTWQTQVGTKIADDADTFGDIIGVDAQDFLAMFFYGMLALAMIFVFFNTQGAETPIVLVLCIPILYYGTVLRVIPLQVTLVVSAIFALLFVRKMWFSST